MTYAEMIEAIEGILNSETLSESAKDNLRKIIKELNYQWNSALSIF